QLENFMDLENAAGVGGAEAAQIHQHGVALAGEPRQGQLPHVVVTKKFRDAKLAFAVRLQVQAIEAQVERAPGIDKAAREAAADEIEKFVRLDGRRGEIGAGDHLNAAHGAPEFSQRVVKPLASLAEGENAQQQQARSG